MYALENTEGVPGTADRGAFRNVIDVCSAPSPQKLRYAPSTDLERIPDKSLHSGQQTREAVACAGG